MLNIERALNDERLLRALSGMNRPAFEQLLIAFDSTYQEIQLNQPRIRAIGGGRKAQLKTAQDKLFFILFYFKCYPTFDVAGLLFDIDRSQAHYWVHKLQPVLERTLGQKMVLPARKIHSIEQFVEQFPTVKRVMIDGTERPIQRPKDPEQQKLNYSGKKKRHTRKHLAAVNEKKRVLILSQARNGQVHDKREKPLRGFPALRLLSKKRIHDRDDLAGSIPEEIPIEVDSGFLGLQKQYDNIHVPHRKPKGGELDETQKEENRLLSSSRVVGENAMRGVKRYDVVSQVDRNRIKNFDDSLMLTPAGLWNWYLMAA